MCDIPQESRQARRSSCILLLPLSLTGPVGQSCALHLGRQRFAFWGCTHTSGTEILLLALSCYSTFIPPKLMYCNFLLHFHYLSNKESSLGLLSIHKGWTSVSKRFLFPRKGKINFETLSRKYNNENSGLDSTVLVSTGLVV